MFYTDTLSQFIKRQLISFLQHGEETGAQKEGLKTMLKEIEFLTGPDLIQQGQLEVILSLKSILFFSTIDHHRSWRRHRRGARCCHRPSSTTTQSHA